MQMTKRNKNAFFQVNTSEIYVRKSKCFSIKPENLLLRVCKIYIGVFLKDSLFHTIE